MLLLLAVTVGWLLSAIIGNMHILIVSKRTKQQEADVGRRRRRGGVEMMIAKQTMPSQSQWQQQQWRQQ